MSCIRILVGEHRSELGDTAAALDNQPDMEIIGTADDEVDLLLQAAAADIVLLGATRGGRTGVVERLLDEYPNVGVLTVDMQHGRAWICQRHPQTEQIAPVTPNSLAAAIRRATEIATQSDPCEERVSTDQGHS